MPVSGEYETLQQFIQHLRSLKLRISSDLEDITREQEHALKDPINYIEQMMNGQVRDLPTFLNIPPLPDVDLGFQNDSEESDDDESDPSPAQAFKGQRKNKKSQQAYDDGPIVKKGRGRPRKNPDDPSKGKKAKGRGRPRKYPLPEASPLKSKKLGTTSKPIPIKPPVTGAVASNSVSNSTKLVPQPFKPPVAQSPMASRLRNVHQIQGVPSSQVQGLTGVPSLHSGPSAIGQHSAAVGPQYQGGLPPSTDNSDQDPHTNRPHLPPSSSSYISSSATAPPSSNASASSAMELDSEMNEWLKLAPELQQEEEYQMLQELLKQKAEQEKMQRESYG